MKDMTVRIRMHPMYADFIKFDFGSNDKDQVFATESKPIGLLLKTMLIRQPFNASKREYNKDSYVEFILPDYTEVNTEYRNYVSEPSEAFIAKKIKNQFYYELTEFFIALLDKNVDEIRTIITMFCEQFEIDSSHYKINTIEREFRRYRDRQKIVRKTKKMSSVLSALFSFIYPLFILSVSFFY